MYNNHGTMNISDRSVSGYESLVSYGSDYGPPAAAGSYSGESMYAQDPYIGPDAGHYEALSHNNGRGKKGRAQQQQQQRWSMIMNNPKSSINSKMQDCYLYTQAPDYSDDDGYRSSGSTVQQRQLMVNEFNRNYNNNGIQNLVQGVAHARKGKVACGGALLNSYNMNSSAFSLPYQTVVINVLTHCGECVRKVKKAVAQTEGMESLSVDMNLRRIIVQGHIDPQNVLKRALKTGKTVSLSLASKGSTIKSMHQFAARADQYFDDSNHHTLQKATMDPPRCNIQPANGGKHNMNNINQSNQQMKGVRFNLVAQGHDSQMANDQRFNTKNVMQGYKQENINAGHSKLENTEYYEQEEGSEFMLANSSDQYLSYVKGERLNQDPDQYLYQRPSTGAAQKFKQKQAQRDLQSSGGEMIFSHNLVYPASRDDGSYIFSEDNANNCCMM